MPTPSPGNPISMDDVRIETNWTRSMYNFFQFSTVGGLGALMYHNLAMGPSSSQTAKEAVYDPFSVGASGTNLNLSAWYDYNQTPNIILSWNITNNNTLNDVTVDIQLYDPASTNYTGFPGGNFTLAAGGGNDTQTNFDTGIAANSTNFANGTYEIAFSTSAMYIGTPPPTSVQNNTTTASDTDGVGAGTARATTNPAAFDQNTPVTQAPYVQGTISGAGIYVNKRTTFTMTFNN